MEGVSPKLENESEVSQIAKLKKNGAVFKEKVINTYTLAS